MTLAEVRDTIIRCCEVGYRLADSECGYSLIRPENVFEESEGVFVMRFRLQVERKNAVQSLAEYACSQVFKCSTNLFIHEEVEYGIPYLDCVWVLGDFGE